MSIKIFVKKCRTKLNLILSKSRFIHFFSKTFSTTKPHLTNSDFNTLNSSKSKDLVIVAHPDDETIFLGSYLLDNSCFVVCLTNKDNYIRNNDFSTVMKLTNSDYIILDYPDLTNDMINNWNKHEKSLISDLNQIINSKIWDKIITHNPYGEYGHIHHKKTSKLVKKTCKHTNNLNKLFYCYYDYTKPLSNFDKKQNLLGIYKEHQPNAINFLFNTSKYETLCFYKDYKKIKIK